MDAELISPSDGVELRVPWIPVTAPLPADFELDRITVRLDGATIEDPLAVVTKRKQRAGGGYHYLAALDLNQLEPGTHDLEVVARKAGWDTHRFHSTFTWDRPPHRVDVEVVDEDGTPLSARILVRDAHGPILLAGPDAWDADPAERDVELCSFFAPEGTGTIYLDPGDYQLVAFAGVRREIDVAELELEDDVEVGFELPVAVDTEGYLAVDLHVHTAHSYDSYTPMRLRHHSLLASGLDVAVLTDHGRITDDAPDLSTSFPPLFTIPGVEADIRAQGPLEGNWDLGHLNAFPLDAGRPLPDRKPETVATYLDDFRQRQAEAPHPDVGDDLVLQLNHPRGIHFHPELPVHGMAWALFNALGFDPAVSLSDPVNAWLIEPEPETGTIALDFDALEVVNRFSPELYAQLRADWFSLWSQGHPLTGTGNSDSHALAVEPAGLPTNLVWATWPGPGGELDVGAVLDGIHHGRVLVTTGPVVELRVVAGGDQAGAGEVLTAQGGAVRAEVRVQAAAWVPMLEVRLVVDGEVVEVLPHPHLGDWAGAGVDLEVSWEVELHRDGWILAEAGWTLDDPELPGGLYAELAPGHVPLGFTNPVRVDVDGDGRWSAPGL